MCTLKDLMKNNTVQPHFYMPHYKMNLNITRSSLGSKMVIFLVLLQIALV